MCGTTKPQVDVPEGYEFIETRVPEPGDLYVYGAVVLKADKNKLSVMRRTPRTIVREAPVEPTPEKPLLSARIYGAGRTTFPINVEVEDTKEEYPLDVEEARQLAKELTEAADEIEERQFVQVRFNRIARPASAGKSPLYTYRDPSGTLQVGDLIQVPVAHSDEPAVVEVAQRGRGTYTGTIRTVAAKLEPRAL